jgi:hypothetical protein
MVRYRHGRGKRFFLDFDDDDDDDEFEDAILLNPFRVTYYLGRGRFGDNSRLHRGIMLIRERGGFSPTFLDEWRRGRRVGRGWKRRRRRIGDLPNRSDYRRYVELP